MDGSEILFPESYNARNTAQGAPTEIRDSKGNRLILRRDPARNLQEIRTPHGHWIKFTYDDLSRIKRAEDDAGHWAKYEYNPDGMLVSAMLSSGGERHYEYDRSLMTRITDEHGRVLIQNWYSSGALIRQWFGNGDEYSYRYDWAPHGYYAEDAIITFPDQTNETLLRVGDSVPNFVKNARR